ncbi:MAG: hypothetical protein QXG39_09430 [Candidatus Aenigmatarchaeota archaeon]
MSCHECKYSKFKNIGYDRVHNTLRHASYFCTYHGLCLKAEHIVGCSAFKRRKRIANKKQ